MSQTASSVFCLDQRISNIDSFDSARTVHFITIAMRIDLLIAM